MRLYKIHFLFFLFLLTTLSAQTEALISMKGTSGMLYGKLLTPVDSDSGTIILIIAGSGPTDGDGNQPGLQNNSLKMVAQGLAEAGISSLRIDKRGVGKSREAATSESDLRFDDMVEDAVLWIEKLKGENRDRKVVVLGHSQGSLVAMLAALQQEVSGIISLAGPGSNAADLIRAQLSSQSAEALKAAEPILEKLEQGQTVDEVPFGLYSLFRPSIQPYLTSWFAYDPTEALAALDIPILVIQGTTDLQVPLQEGQRLAETNSSAELLVLENMNHVLKEAPAERSQNLDTYSNDTLALHSDLVPGLVAFINRLD